VLSEYRNIVRVGPKDLLQNCFHNVILNFYFHHRFIHQI